MFKLTRPCVNCPFKKGVGERFCLNENRLNEIFNGVAFQCHKTVDYDAPKGERSGDRPQQCAGLMSILHCENRSNQIMQVGERLGAFHPDRLDHSEVYASIADAVRAHTGVSPADELECWFADNVA